MKKVFGLAFLTLVMSLPSFAAEHLVTHSVKTTGKDTYKVTAVTAKHTAKAGTAAVKFLF